MVNSLNDLNVSLLCIFDSKGLIIEEKSSHDSWTTENRYNKLYGITKQAQKEKQEILNVVCSKTGDFVYRTDKIR